MSQPVAGGESPPAIPTTDFNCALPYIKVAFSIAVIAGATFLILGELHFFGEVGSIGFLASITIGSYVSSVSLLFLLSTALTRAPVHVPTQAPIHVSTTEVKCEKDVFISARNSLSSTPLLPSLEMVEFPTKEQFLEGLETGDFDNSIELPLLKELCPRYLAILSSFPCFVIRTDHSLTKEEIKKAPELLKDRQKCIDEIESTLEDFKRNKKVSKAIEYVQGLIPQVMEAKRILKAPSEELDQNVKTLRTYINRERAEWYCQSVQKARKICNKLPRIYVPNVIIPDYLPDCFFHEIIPEENERTFASIPPEEKEEIVRELTRFVVEMGFSMSMDHLQFTKDGRVILNVIGGNCNYGVDPAVLTLRRLASLFKDPSHHAIIIEETKKRSNLNISQDDFS
ncbi:MAG: hypothetical protein S4CHLAM45_06890 [Chlamydiales bacterium]|nr:hypothetical protein [Chlamydiales bacterium]MCH9620293.1 hypothetical protein [Chlamydiales bacterium]MCH9622796.1 hypothetical protein [Chlamydiales bacterium]